MLQKPYVMLGGTLIGCSTFLLIYQLMNGQKQHCL